MSILLYNPLQDLIESRDNFRFSNCYYTPKTDVYESKNEIIIKMDLPGIARENISIEASSIELEIKTEFPKQSNDSSNDQKQTEKDESNLIARHVERRSQNYYRKFKFNKPVDSQKAKVNLQDGVLTVTLPLSPEAQKRTLSIE